MLPILLYNNMEGSSNSLNNTPNGAFNSFYDENLILNCVRSRKKVTELPNCPICSCTIRHGELESHLALEVERLHKISTGGTKRKLSCNSSGSGSSLAVPGSSTSVDLPEESEIDVTGCPGSDVYQRVKSNRIRRLRARRRSPPPQQGECPVCNVTMPTSKLQRHALRCLKRTGAEVDEDIPDSSSEEGSIDVENDSSASGSFGAEYQWCGEWRVRASALGPQPAGTALRRASNDHALVVDGDEDTELYGPPQYSPSRIAPDPETTQDQEESTSAEGERRTQSNGEDGKQENSEPKKPSEMVEASAETRVQALKAKIKELISVEDKMGSDDEGGTPPGTPPRCRRRRRRGKRSRRQRSSSSSSSSSSTSEHTKRKLKCLICLGPYTSPAVSIQCWHVYCEECWLQSLRAKKICPQCNAITTTEHLRRIYM